MFLFQGDYTVPEFMFTAPCSFPRETILYQSLCSLPHVPFPGRLYCSRVCVHCPMFLSQGDYTVPEFVFTAPCSFPRETILFQSLCSLPRVPFPGRQQSQRGWSWPTRLSRCPWNWNKCASNWPWRTKRTWRWVQIDRCVIWQEKHFPLSSCACRAGTLVVKVWRRWV